jgi:hypothetical protein
VNRMGGIGKSLTGDSASVAGLSQYRYNSNPRLLLS